MHSRWHVGGGLLFGVLAAATVRGDTTRGFGFQLAAQTPHFLFYSRHGEPIDVHEVERSLRKVQQLLGQELAGRAEYYRYATPQEVAANVGPYASGVTFGALRQIHSTQECHLHEIVHLVAAQLGNPGAFFQEGLAVALGGSKWRGRGQAHARVAPSLRRQKVSVLAARFEAMDAETAYPLAGSFVGYLIKTYGVSRVAEFFRACGRSGVPQDAAFRATFGQGLDEAGAAWSGAPGGGRLRRDRQGRASRR